jgi:hypothetical protein
MSKVINVEQNKDIFLNWFRKVDSIIVIYFDAFFLIFFSKIQSHVTVFTFNTKKFFFFFLSFFFLFFAFLSFFFIFHPLLFFLSFSLSFLLSFFLSFFFSLSSFIFFFLLLIFSGFLSFSSCS